MIRTPSVRAAANMAVEMTADRSEPYPDPWERGQAQTIGRGDRRGALNGSRYVDLNHRAERQPPALIAHTTDLGLANTSSAALETGQLRPSVSRLDLV